MASRSPRSQAMARVAAGEVRPGRSTPITSAPAARRTRAISAPMPPAVPVTSAFCPASDTRSATAGSSGLMRRLPRRRPRRGGGPSRASFRTRKAPQIAAPSAPASAESGWLRNVNAAFCSPDRLLERGDETLVGGEAPGHQHDAAGADRDQEPQVTAGHRLVDALDDVGGRDAARHHVDDVGLGEHGADRGAGLGVLGR